MINQASVTAVDSSRWEHGFVKPLYGSYCFSEIAPAIEGIFNDAAVPPATERLLGPLANSETSVILLFIDGFGWRFLEQYGDRYPFLRRYTEHGVVSKLSSQFPSTTAAHVTSIHTGLDVAQSGIYEWFQYEPQLDAIIAPLLFSFAAGNMERNTLQPTGIRPEQLFPRHTVYQRLAEHGVPSFVLQSRDYTPSALSSVVCDGATITPFDDLQGGLNSLCALNESLKTRYYATLYWGAIDAASHHDGPESPQFADAVDSCFQLLESALHRRLTEHGRKTLLLLTADHGQTAVDPATTIYLNREVPGIDGWIARNRRGDLLVPAGSARDMFLHIYPDRLDEAEMRLREHLQGRAAVHRVDDLIAQGFFGRGEPGRAFLERVANLVVLPLGQESVWWLEPGKFSMTFRGHHGGLTPAEMETELLALAYG